MELADAKAMPSRTRDDRYVKKAHKFITRLRKNNPRTELHLKSKHPELYNAFEIYDTAAPMRWLLEAGIIANEPVPELALYLNTSEKVIETYETMFFDVRGVLENKGCIYAKVLAPGISHGAISQSPEIFWKMIAYEGGWEVVRSIFETGTTPPAVMDFYRQGFINRTIKNGFISTACVPTNGFNSSEREKLALDLIQKEEEIGAAAGGDVAHNAMSGLLKSISISVLPSATPPMAEEPRLQTVLLPEPKVVKNEEE